MDKEKIAAGVRLLLEGVGEDAGRSGLADTPSRVAEMFEEILGGTHQAAQLSPGIPEEMSNDLIIIRDISFYSLCEHHLLPFFGKVHIAYLPQNKKVAGFSGLTRIVDVYARRLQIQERFTYQIADTIMESLTPRGVIVLVEAQQLCVSMRGSKKNEVRTRTQAIRGDIPLDRLQISRFFESSIS
ncbi:MAG: GTP cyclohydrolase I FolE [Calditrichia bacterium]